MTANPELETSEVKHQSLTTEILPGPFTFYMANVTGGDIQFFTDLTAIFCDPQHAKLLDGVRAGRMGIYRDPLTHKCLVSDLFTPPLIIAKQNSKN